MKKTILRNIFHKMWDFIPSKRFLGILGIIWGLIFLCFGFYYSIERYTFKQTAISTQAEIINLIEEKDNNGQILYRPEVSFLTMNGDKIITEISFSSTPPIGRIGDEIEILYNNDTPEQARLGKYRLLLSIYWGLISFGIITIGYGILILYKFNKYHKSRKKWKCMKCGTKNSVQFDTCFKCGEKKN